MGTVGLLTACQTAIYYYITVAEKSFLLRMSGSERERLAQLSKATGLSQGEILRRLLSQAEVAKTVELRRKTTEVCQ